MALKDYVVKRSIEVVILLFLAVNLNFFIFRVMPGNPFAYFIENPSFNPETRNALIARFGLNRPLSEQWLIYIKNMFTGEFGVSFVYLRPVIDVMIERLPNTIILIFSSTLLSVVIGVLVGTVAAWKRGGKLDVGLQISTMTLYSMPVFWLGLIIILVFAYYLGLIPFGGTITRGLEHSNVFEYFLDYSWHLLPPMLTLTSVNFGAYFLLMRNTLLDVFSQDYILTAKAAGLRRRTILLKYGMRNALLPVVTMTAISLGFAVSGAVLTESVFSWYGMGRLIYRSVLERDYPVLEGCFWLISLCVLIANFIADILYAYLDPRIKY